MAMIIEYTYKIILGAIVIAILVSIFYLIKGDLLSILKQHFVKKEHPSINKNVTLSGLLLLLEACYEKRTDGVCYVAIYNDATISCNDLIKLARKRDIPVAPCYFNISKNDLLTIKYEKGLVYIEK